MMIPVSRKITLYILKIIFSITFFFFLFKIINIHSVTETLYNVKLEFVGLIILFVVIFWIITTISIWILIRPYRRINLMKFVEFNSISLAVGHLTPSQIGEAILVLYLKHFSFGIKKGMAIFLFNKIINFSLIFLFGLYGLKYYGLFNIKFIVPFILILIIFLISIFTKLRILIKEFIIKRYFMRFYDFFRMISDLIKEKYLYVILNIFCNFIRIILAGFIIWLCFKAVGLNVNYFIVLFIYNLGKIPTFLPLSLSGLGILESGTTFLLYKLGFDSQIVLSGLLLNRALGLLLTIIVMILVLSKTEYYVPIKKLIVQGFKQNP